MDDGRLNILTRGTRPFRLVERQEDLPYPAGTSSSSRTRTRSATTARREAAREAYGELVEQATDKSPRARASSTR